MRYHRGRLLFPRLWCGMLAILLFWSFPIRTYAKIPVFRSVPTTSKKIAITFDDGPHPRLTPQILGILEKYNVKATFFMVGCNVLLYPQAAQQVILSGHEVGNHTFSHRHISAMNEYALQAEIERCEDALEELCEYRPHLFRPPQGVLNSDVEHCSARGDYTVVLWSLDTRDWENKNAQSIADTILSNIKGGDIILMHDYVGVGSQTPQALELLLPRLLEQGFVPVTVSELLRDEVRDTPTS